MRQWSSFVYRTISALRCAAACIAFAALLLSPDTGFARDLSGDQLEQLFPVSGSGASFAGGFEGDPPAAPVYRDGRLVGYAFSTLDVVGSTGYAGAPIDVLVGIDLEGRIAGALLAQHNEPILVIGIPEERLRAFVSGFSGFDFTNRVEEITSGGAPGYVAGATVSSAVIQDAIVRAARAVAWSRNIMGADGAGAGGARLDRSGYEPANWSTLINDGSLVEKRFTRGEIEDFLTSRGAPRSLPLSEDERADTFLHLYAGLATPPRIGNNLLGSLAYNRLLAAIGPSDNIVIVAAHGLYSFKGTSYRQSGSFDRVQLVQGSTTIPLATVNYRNVEALSKVVGEAAELREIGIFVVPADTGFDPLAPWRVEVRIDGNRTDIAPPPVVSMEYGLPVQYRLTAVPPEAARERGLFDASQLWRKSWQANWGKIAGLIILLTALTAILMFQDFIVSRTRHYRKLRIGFLLVTVVWLGYYAGAQLSVVNVLTFIGAVMGDFRWEYFLVDPMAFILWSFVALAMLFWGRGVFCGWLCPFGALHGLLHFVGQKFRLPQIQIPFLLNERLWPIKYILFLGLLAVSLNSMTLAIKGSEVEPFKTAITLGFVRHWPFLFYVGVLLVVGLFIERFFCRYLCPMGAALAIPARLRMFDWLLRRAQCGTECNICATNCPVQAIHPDGSINPNECIHCLKCQSLFYDDTSCPPLIARRKRREQRRAVKERGATAAETSNAG